MAAPLEEHILRLIARYVDQSLSTSEKEELDNWMNASEENRKMLEQIANEKELLSLGIRYKKFGSRSLHAKDEVHHRLSGARMRTFLRLAAACIVLVMGYIGWNLYSSYERSSLHQGYSGIAGPAADIPPGHPQAELILSNGQHVKLDSTNNGMVLNQSGATTLNANGVLTYHVDNEKGIDTAYNTIMIPRGGQYRVKLPDGTLVWLNAASALRYPIAFTGRSRIVELEGEAYFEVVHEDSRPFKVKVAGEEIEDIGTHFNVNAYGDEPYITTTLLEGKVKVTGSHSRNTAVLKPGEQARIDSSGTIKLARNVDLNDVVAWMHGQFSVNNMGVASLMKTLSRWYDVDIRYEGEVPQGKFGGLIDRDVYLSNVLSVLNANGINARLEGRIIIVSSK